VPNRKQRRRREKDFRHDVRVFEVDEEGNEVAIAELRSREESEKPKGKPQAKQGRRGGGSSRAGREVPPPSWGRAVKRGGLMGSLMLVVFVFVLKNGPIAQRLAIGIFYALAFVPLTYYVDRFAYRGHLRRQARGSGSPKSSAKKS
jgi:hypothetical protein